MFGVLFPHQTKQKLTQVPIEKAHAGQQYPGTDSDPDIIERSKWAITESPLCYTDGLFTPVMDALVSFNCL